jgi:hypothetical protein
MDAVLQPFESKADLFVSNIEKLVARMDRLKDAAHAAQQSDMKDAMDVTGKGE